jgi:hypothetical protein
MASMVRAPSARSLNDPDSDPGVGCRSVGQGPGNRSTQTPRHRGVAFATEIAGTASGSMSTGWSRRAVVWFGRDVARATEPSNASSAGKARGRRHSQNAAACTANGGALPWLAHPPSVWSPPTAGGGRRVGVCNGVRRIAGHSVLLERVSHPSPTEATGSGQPQMDNRRHRCPALPGTSAASRDLGGSTRSGPESGRVP